MKLRLHAVYCLTEKSKRWFSARFTPLGKACLVAVGIAFFFGLSVQRTMIYQIFSGVVMLLFCAFFLTLKMRVQLKISRLLPATCVTGRSLNYRIVVENNGKRAIRGLYLRELVNQTLPSYTEFCNAREDGEERRNLFDRKMGYYRWLWLLRLRRQIDVTNSRLPEIGAGQRREVELSLLPLRRGNVHLQGFVLGRVDPFGLCKKEVEVTEAGKLLVLPRLYPVPQLFFQGSRKYHQGGITAAQERGDSNEFVALREYSHGDPVKHIDWKSTARCGTAIVKQYRDEYFSRYGLVLDSFSPLVHSQPFEEAVALAASVMMSQDTMNSVVDLLFVENECVTCTMGRGLTGQGQMLEILAAVQTCRDKPFSELAGLVQEHIQLLSGLIVILLDLDNDRMDLLHFLASHGVPVRVILISSNRVEMEQKTREFEPPVEIRLADTDAVEKQVAQL